MARLVYCKVCKNVTLHDGDDICQEHLEEETQNGDTDDDSSEVL